MHSPPPLDVLLLYEVVALPPLWCVGCNRFGFLFPFRIEIGLTALCSSNPWRPVGTVCENDNHYLAMIQM